MRRDLLAGQMLDTELGLGYEDECLGISIAYRRKFTTDRDVPPSTTIVLQVQPENRRRSDHAVQPVPAGRVLPSLNRRRICLFSRPG